MCLYFISCFFFFNDTATTEIYTLSLHDALPISPLGRAVIGGLLFATVSTLFFVPAVFSIIHGLRREAADTGRSEEHTSELQSRLHLVCRLLLEKKKACSRFHPPYACSFR